MIQMFKVSIVCHDGGGNRVSEGCVLARPCAAAPACTCACVYMCSLRVHCAQMARRGSLGLSATRALGTSVQGSCARLKVAQLGWQVAWGCICSAGNFISSSDALTSLTM